jgi:hypothetical protein
LRTPGTALRLTSRRLEHVVLVLDADDPARQSSFSVVIDYSELPTEVLHAELSTRTSSRSPEWERRFIDMPVCRLFIAASTLHITGVRSIGTGIIRANVDDQIADEVGRPGF